MKNTILADGGASDENFRGRGGRALVARQGGSRSPNGQHPAAVIATPSWGSHIRVNGNYSSARLVSLNH